MIPVVKQILLVLVILVRISESLYIADNKSDRNCKFSKCITQIIKNIPETVRKISFLTTRNSSLSVETDIIREIQVPVVINAIEIPKISGPDDRIPNDLIVIENDRFDVSSVLKNILWNRDTKFVVVTDLENIDFGGFWKENIVNAYYLCDESEDISLYGFVPYGADACDNLEPVLLDKWRGDAFVSGGFYKIYEKIKINNMHKCPVNISVVNVKPVVFFPDGCVGDCNPTDNIDGIEARFMNEVAVKLNFTAWYSMPSDRKQWGRIFPTRGVVGEVYKGASKFGFGYIAPVMERHENLDLSRNFDDIECITFATPAGSGRDRLSWLKNFTGDLTLIEWLLLVLSLVCVVIIVWIASNFTFSASFLFTFRVLMGDSTKVPKTRSLKYLIALWIIFSSSIGDIYQASLGSQIIVPIQPPNINNILELAKSDLQFLGHQNMLDIINESLSIPGMIEIKNRFIVTQIELNSAISRMMSERDIAYIRHRSTFLHAILNNPKAKENLKVLEQCAYEYFPAIAMRKNSPFTRRTNEVVNKIFESGIGIYWKSFFIPKMPPIRPDFVPMELKRSLGIVVIFLIGLLVSFLVFLGELFLGKRRNSGRKKILKRNLKLPSHFSHLGFKK